MADTGTDAFQNIDLLTASGERAATIKSLPWKKPPEALMWGDRTFFLQAGRYVEGLMFWVPPALFVDPTPEQCGWVFEPDTGETLPAPSAAPPEGA